MAAIQPVRTAALGISCFGQAGSLDEVYRYHGVDEDAIIRAALDIVG